MLKYSPMSVDNLGDQSLGVCIDSDGTTLLQQFTLDGPTLVNAGTGGLTNAEADAATKLLGTSPQLGLNQTPTIGNNGYWRTYLPMAH
ncbi:hypothetical protein [Streptomyces echinatus]|uniref:hypothetical protein n=1 Tax=Streptomyces echinatus TaxID=67293 RepID=UPI00381C8C01